MIWIMGVMDAKKQMKPAWLKKLVFFFLLAYKDIKYHNVTVLENLQEKYIPMVVHFRIMQRSVSKQEDLINFVNGGMVLKTGMLSAFAKLMNAILI